MKENQSWAIKSGKDPTISDASKRPLKYNLKKKNSGKYYVQRESKHVGCEFLLQMTIGIT